MEKRKYDNTWLGVLAGLLAPIIVGIIYYLIFYGDHNLEQFIQALWRGNVLMAVLSLCAVANLGIFFLFLRKDNYRSARGVILATMLYAIAVLINKFR